jgi:hypothetical protein
VQCAAKRRAAAVVLCVVVAAFAGCGGSATRSEVVASVARNPISKETLTHWMSVKRIELQGRAASEGEVRDKALEFLITSAWLEGEAAARGVRVPPAEATAAYEHLLHAPDGTAFAESVKRRGLSRADEILVLRLGELAQGVRATITAGASRAQQQPLVNAFLAAYRARWKQRTTCSRGYVVADCRNGPPLASAPGA